MKPFLIATFSLGLLGYIFWSNLHRPLAFRLLEATDTGLDFNNRLQPTADMNIFNYMYFFNGGGIGAGDFNHDGLIDLFFSANTSENKLYLNKGNLKFEDITTKSGIRWNGGWSTGVSVVDINNDGWLDIYVSQVGEFKKYHTHNQLFVCQGLENGTPIFKEQAQSYGLDLVGFGTQAAFLDFDLDGDLDMFQLNHSIHQNGTFGPRKSFLGTFHPLSGDKFMRNDQGKFVDITSAVGINSNVVGYGLGVAVADINLDGYPDIYVTNDFHENDYLYINQKNGTFKDMLDTMIPHTSRFSMGVDIGDLNNDIYPEIMTLDMLPNDYQTLKRSDGEDAFGIYNYKLGYGYNHQYSRNCLQLNNGDNTFSDIGFYSGVAATDWSWSTLFTDFDSDGKKDIFISNGIAKRMNDLDYMNFVLNDAAQEKIKNKKFDDLDLELSKLLPEEKFYNVFYHQDTLLKFRDLQFTIEHNKKSFSNGAIYADLDNDGDEDVVTNNINDFAFLYENKSEAKGLMLTLKGTGNQPVAGAKVVAYFGTKTLYREKQTIHGFQSSMEVPLHFGLIGQQLPDSLVIQWPDGSFQVERQITSKNLTIQCQGAQEPERTLVPHEFPLLFDVTSSSNLNYEHIENDFNELDREPLMPHMVSQEGPALAVGDVDHDGDQDFYVGSSRYQKAQVWLRNMDGTYFRSKQPFIEQDSMYEEIDAKFADFNGDGSLDLIIGNGGNEFYNTSEYHRPRLYLNDGKGTFKPRNDLFEDINIVASCVEVADYDKDGDLDIFLGARAKPWAYGEIPTSLLMINKGNLKFEVAKGEVASGLSNIGLVKDACWVDLDKDQDMDLVVATEWGPIYRFINDRGTLRKSQLTNLQGWWNTIEPVDYDSDGDIDLLAGNLGTNSKFQVSQLEPLRMYYYDYDHNGKKEQFLTYYLNHQEVPFASFGELKAQLPSIKKKYLYAKNFASASKNEIMGKNWKKAAILSANCFESGVFLNDGKGNFTFQAFPANFQYSTVQTFAFLKVSQLDSIPDILSFGNFYPNNIQLGRYDASYGNVILRSYDGPIPIPNTLGIAGQIRKAAALNGDLLIIRNNGKASIIGKKGTPYLSPTPKRFR